MKTTQNKKTVGKTTELGMKGVQDIRKVVNEHIININRLYHTRVELYTDKEILDYLERRDLKDIAVKLGQIHDVLVNHARDAYRIALNETHPSEKTPKAKSNTVQQSEAIQETTKKATAQTRAKMNKALYKQLKEEKEAATKAASNSTKKGGE